MNFVSLIKKFLLCFISIFVVIFLFAKYGFFSIKTEGSDLIAYWSAYKLAQSGQNPYDPD